MRILSSELFSDQKDGKPCRDLGTVLTIVLNRRLTRLSASLLAEILEYMMVTGVRRTDG